MISVDCLKHIVSFLDWTCDFGILDVIVRSFELTTDEQDIILTYWNKCTKFKTTHLYNKMFFTCNDKIHRIAGPAVVYDCGDREWWQNGLIHRDDGPAIDASYGVEWWRNGLKHRENGPAVETNGGRKEYWKHGKLHRTDGPAVFWEDTNNGLFRRKYGKREWWQNGKLHRTDDPAIEWGYGAYEWYVDGLLHRIDGPAIIIKNHHEEWYQNGKRHRLDGPAFISYSVEKWYQNDKLHRIGGPAIEYPDGKKEWYVNGKLHRIDGPAVEYTGLTVGIKELFGKRYDKQWWRNGIKVGEVKWSNAKIDD